MKRRITEHYVDNAKLHQAMIEYKESVKHAKENGNIPPRVPDYVGECILKIAKRLATKSNFSSYPFLEDMIMDGVTNCLQYIDNFNPEYKKPFAYFTQIIYFAFIRRIKKEKKVLYTKYKVMEKMDIFESDPGLSGRKDSPATEYSKKYMQQFIEDYEKSN